MPCSSSNRAPTRPVAWPSCRLGRDGTVADVAPRLNVRTRVHEYGGGAYAVRDGVIVFSEFAANRLMLRRPSDVDPVELVADPALRFADMEIDADRRRVIAVLEDQRASTSLPRNLLCAVSLSDGSLIELAGGHDFTSDPRLSPERDRLAFLTWDLPRMPWDGTDLWVAPISADGLLGQAVHVAGGVSESIAQPRWAPDGSLVFVSDRSGWWNLYRWRPGMARAEPLAPMEAEFAGPQWVFGLSDVDIDADGTIVASAVAQGRSGLLVLRRRRASSGGPGRCHGPGLRARPRRHRHRRGRLMDAAYSGHPARPAQRQPGAASRERPAGGRGGPPVGATARHLPDLGRPGRPRLVLPARRIRTWSRPRASGRRSWSCPTVVRRVRRALSLSLERQVFTSRGIRGRGCRLRRLDRLRPRLPRPAP